MEKLERVKKGKIVSFLTGHLTERKIIHVYIEAGI